MSSFLESSPVSTVKNGHAQNRLSSGYQTPSTVNASVERSKVASAPPPPVSEFNLTDMGIDQANLIADIVPTFDKLPLDVYEKRRQEIEYLRHHFSESQESLEHLNAFFNDYMCGKASLNDLANLTSLLSQKEVSELEATGAVRFRAIAKFEVNFAGSQSPRIHRVPADAFVQMTGDRADFRVMPRYFEEASDYLTDDIEIRQILRAVAFKVRLQHPVRLDKLAITLHQVVVRVDSATPFHLPDGIHRDGADYIVSAIPLLMDGVVPPLSTVYDSQVRPILETHLGIGQGLLHDDRSYWHSVSSVVSTGGSGRRGTIGLDVQIAG
ncbi:MAG TPA: 2OG-Fe dioxygenase family protein [Oculatellaceae cyanobacterium]